MGLISPSQSGSPGVPERAALMRKIILSLLIILSVRANASSTPWLHSQGLTLANTKGAPVTLRGVNLGGAFLVEVWQSALNLEHTGSNLPDIKDEWTLWQTLSDRFGRAKMKTLREAWRNAWISPDDISRLKKLGCNAVRIPFNYRMVQKPDEPGVLRKSGIERIELLLNRCKNEGVYAILDMHGAPGRQSDDQPTGRIGRNLLFKDAQKQQETIALWTALAKHFASHSEIAGYDLLNEPMGAPDGKALISFYNRLYAAIRAVDSRHILFMEDGYKGIQIFPRPADMGWENVCYSLHFYQFGANSPEVHYQFIADYLLVVARSSTRPLSPVPWKSTTRKGVVACGFGNYSQCLCRET